MKCRFHTVTGRMVRTKPMGSAALLGAKHGWWRLYYRNRCHEKEGRPKPLRLRGAGAEKNVVSRAGIARAYGWDGVVFHYAWAGLTRRWQSGPCHGEGQSVEECSCPTARSHICAGTKQHFP